MLENSDKIWYNMQMGWTKQANNYREESTYDNQSLIWG